jgi:hypothetical protein
MNFFGENPPLRKAAARYRQPVENENIPHYNSILFSFKPY